MGGNISGYNFLGGSFPGGIRQGGGGGGLIGENFPCGSFLDTSFCTPLKFFKSYLIFFYKMFVLY